MRCAIAGGAGCPASTAAAPLRPCGSRPERRNSGVDDDAEVEVDEATAMVTIEVLDAVAVHEDDAHHHEAVVVEADLVSESRKQPFFVIR